MMETIVQMLLCKIYFNIFIDVLLTVIKLNLAKPKQD